MNLETLLSKFSGVRKTATGWQARCPAHEDRKASLSISVDGDKILMHDHAGCETPAILEKIGLKPKDLFLSPPIGGIQKKRIIAEYSYHDEAGNTLYQAVRYDPKDFRQRRPDHTAKDGWAWNMKGVRRVPYHLPDLLKSSGLVFIAEGEKDTDALRSLGLTATCNVGGAGKWKPEYAQFFKNRHVVIIPDNDKPGRKHAEDVAAKLRGHAEAVTILELPGTGKDAFDWIRAGGTKAELLALWGQNEETPPTPEPVALQPLIPAPVAQLVLSPLSPLVTAKAFLSANMKTLRRYAELYLDWTGNHYRQLEEEALRSRLYKFLEGAMRPGDKGKPVPFDPSRQKVDTVLDAVKAVTFLEEKTPIPSWIGPATGPSPVEIIPCKSGLFHVPTGKMLPADSSFFNTSALPFDPDLNAGSPVQWLKFLSDLWPNDPDSIKTLKEWFGYCLTADTRQQKMMLLVGPKRSGKGTIARILTQLLGTDAVAGPTTNSLATQFGLQPLIGKSLAIVSDARFTGTPDHIIVAERLLNISGEDALTIPRKYSEDVTLKLPTRFMFLSNELPRLTDASGALAGRFIVLQLIESFFGKEDVNLTDRLLSELPQILNWSLEGLRRLKTQGRFVQPGSALEAIAEMEAMGSPIKAFVDDCCVVGAQYEVDKGQLYTSWQKWCEKNGRDHRGTTATFGKDLRALLPGLKITNNRMDAGNRVRSYQGIALATGSSWNRVDQAGSSIGEML
ncbi:MAG: hypothetical protein COW41_01995 [Deltaproteobacteria bacterium CG17_big_fil_post_rev_8_21_14_2_50_51_6]|nr:MAG: hypothetical protein COW41_01995 [Deltaproteobacteria bacterium CG17_big_fil_post_rev_8_21_14_2_50_51_6]